MDVFNDKSWLKLWRIDNEYKKYLDVFLDHAFVTSSNDNKIAYPCAICGNQFHYEKEIVRGYLIMKEMDLDYQKYIWIFPWVVEHR